MKYGLMIIRDSEDWIIKVTKLGVLNNELVSGHNNTTTDSDGVSVELLVFNNCKGYNAYAELMENICNNL